MKHPLRRASAAGLFFAPRRLVLGAFLLAVAGQRLSAQTAVTPGACDGGSGHLDVTGVVVDMLSRRPLPGAVVQLRAPAAFVPQLLGRYEAAAGGRYAFCAPSVGQGWDVVAELDTVQSRAIPVPPTGQVDTIFIAWSQPVTLTGTVREHIGGKPVDGARITVQDRPVRATTDEAGRFGLRGLGGGPLIIRTSHIAYGERVDTIVAESGGNLMLDIRLGERAIELAPIVVTARAAPSLRARGMREMGMTRDQVAAALPRSIDFVSLLRQAQVPGLMVRESGNGICVEFLRGGGGCAMLQVFVNGMRIQEPEMFLPGIDPVSVSEFVVLRPAFAQFQYMGPLTQNGVLDITLRGGR